MQRLLFDTTPRAISTDARAAEQSRSGVISPEEFRAAYLTGRARTERLVRSKGFSSDEAQELSQAAWVRAWERRDQLRDAGAAVSWVGTIALNLGRDLRRRDRTVPLEEPEAARDEAPNLTAPITVRQILDGCSGDDRRLLEDHYLRGWRLTEIAQRQGRPTATVRVRLHRIRAMLRRDFGKRITNFGFAPAS